MNSLESRIVKLVGFRTRVIGGRKIVYPVFEGESAYRKQWKEQVGDAKVRLKQAQRVVETETKWLRNRLKDLYPGGKIPPSNKLQKMINKFIETGEVPSPLFSTKIQNAITKHHEELKQAEKSLRKLLHQGEALKEPPDKVLLPKNLAEKLSAGVDIMTRVITRKKEFDEDEPEEDWERQMFEPGLKIQPIWLTKGSKVVDAGGVYKMVKGGAKKIQKILGEALKKEGAGSKKTLAGIMFCSSDCVNPYQVIQLFSKLPIVVWYQHPVVGVRNIPLLMVVNLKGKGLPKDLVERVRGSHGKFFSFEYGPDEKEYWVQARSEWNNFLEVLDEFGYEAYYSFSFFGEFKRSSYWYPD